MNKKNRLAIIMMDADIKNCRQNCSEKCTVFAFNMKKNADFPKLKMCQVYLCCTF